ncbi:MAG: RDD family protein, partial [Casimicrobium sp.]
NDESALWFFVVKAVLICGPLAYYPLCESGKYRSTWGKRWLGLRVYRSDGETPVGILRGLARFFLRVISAVPLYLGYIIAFFTERKQALHDLASDTVVYQAEDPPSYWILKGITSVLVVSFLLNAVSTKLMSNVERRVISEMGALSPEKYDADRLTPGKREVQVAYAASLAMQVTLRQYHNRNERWPEPAERDQLLAQFNGQTADMARILRDYELTLAPKGKFALSLGATTRGTARMIFIPPSGKNERLWDCIPIKIDSRQQIEQCGAGF